MQQPARKGCNRASAYPLAPLEAEATPEPHRLQNLTGDDCAFRTDGFSCSEYAQPKEGKQSRSISMPDGVGRRMLRTRAHWRDVGLDAWCLQGSVAYVYPGCHSSIVPEHNALVMMGRYIRQVGAPAREAQEHFGATFASQRPPR